MNKTIGFEYESDPEPLCNCSLCYTFNNIIIFYNYIFRK